MFIRAVFACAFAAVAFAQTQAASSVLTFTRTPNPATAGEQFAITYATNDTTTPVTILLRKGDPNDLETVSTLTTDATNGQYIWTPSLNLDNDNDYALQIEQGDQVNYFGPFTIQGATGAEEDSSSSASSMTASATGLVPSNSSSSRTMTGIPPYVTGNATTPRNTTTSSPNMTRPTTSGTNGPASTDDAGFQSTQSADPAQSTGNSAPIVAGSSAMALVLGAVGAIVLG